MFQYIHGHSIVVQDMQVQWVWFAFCLCCHGAIFSDSKKSPDYRHLLWAQDRLVKAPYFGVLCVGALSRSAESSNPSSAMKAFFYFIFLTNFVWPGMFSTNSNIGRKTFVVSPRPAVSSPLAVACSSVACFPLVASSLTLAHPTPEQVETEISRRWWCRLHVQAQW